VNDVDQTPIDTGLPSALNGSLFVSHDAASGDVTVGASQTPGAASPGASGTYAGIQAQWKNGDLLASFFMRSGPISPWQGASGEVVFSNFRVLDGSPTSVPEPTSLALACFAMGGLAPVLLRRYRRSD
jgi:hypothetical protein